MSYVVRPISDRTAFTGKQVDSQFTVTWSQAEQLLLTELRNLQARDVVLELDLPESAIRLDRRPSYRWNKGMQEHWQHNVYAIAKALEALRLVDRYGVTGRGQQYTGFKALPAGGAMPASHMTRDEALTVVAKIAYPGASDQSLSDERIHALASDDNLGRLLRRAKGRAHPDSRGGNRGLWDALEEAVKALGLSL